MFSARKVNNRTLFARTSNHEQNQWSSARIYGYPWLLPNCTPTATPTGASQTHHQKLSCQLSFFSLTRVSTVHHFPSLLFSQALVLDPGHRWLLAPDFSCSVSSPPTNLKQPAMPCSRWPLMYPFGWDPQDLYETHQSLFQGNSFDFAFRPGLGGGQDVSTAGAFERYNCFLFGATVVLLC